MLLTAGISYDSEITRDSLSTRSPLQRNTATNLPSPSMQTAWQLSFDVTIM